MVDSVAAGPVDVEMSVTNPKKTDGPVVRKGNNDTAASAAGVSPYATGGGGVTFERKVAVLYLAHLLVGDGASEFGDGRRVLSVAFQQAPDHPVDDLVVNAGLPDELQPSLVLTLAVRRSPNLVLSDESARRLVRQFVREMTDAPTEGPEHRMCLVVAGPQEHAEQLATLASHAKVQMDAAGFFDLIRTPRKFPAALQGRLAQVASLVECALQDLSVATTDAALIQQRTWELLSRLEVSMPQLESPDETDWAGVANSLIPVARGSDPTAASQLRDRLVALVNEYSPRAARVNLKLLRRDAHAMLDPTTRRNQKGWQVLDHLHRMARAAVRNEITGSDGSCVSLDRSREAAKLIATATKGPATVVSGESGVGKSALAVLGVTAAGDTDSDSLQALCINLRQVPKLSVQFEAALGCPLSTLLCELSASQRMVIIDAADAIAEGRADAFRYLVDAAHNSELKVIAVTSVESQQVVRDRLTDRLGTGVKEHTVAPLSEAEIGEIVKAFAELSNLNSNARARELLRRLVVVDLLVRVRVQGVPLTDADAMQEVWSGLVRRREMSDRGSPDDRQFVLLKLAALALRGVSDMDASSSFASAAVAGLRRDGLLQTSPDDPFKIGPEFAHDEVRRYAVARLLLSDDTPATRILQAGAPRWSLSAAQLACQTLLACRDTAIIPLRGRLSRLQASFDRLVDAGHGARWGDVPGEGLLALADPKAVLRDAWTGLLANDGAGLRRLARLVDQRHRRDNSFVDIRVIEPIIALLLDDVAPWQSGKHAQDMLRDWLHAHVVAKTRADHPLRILLRERLVEACIAGDLRLTKEREAELTRVPAEERPLGPKRKNLLTFGLILSSLRRLFRQASKGAVRTPKEVKKARRFAKRHKLSAEIGYGGRPRRQRPEVPYEITDETVLELLALLGPDLGGDGEAILRRVARDAPESLYPAVEELLTGPALAHYGGGLLAHLAEAYYLDDEADGTDFDDYGVRDHRARGLGHPLATWYLGPFMSLFQSDFRLGTAVLNRLLNHAARNRARCVATPGALGAFGPQLDDGADDLSETELEITGTRRRYVGDEHVWRWYRGTGVGPYPCLSALQALERVCDQLIEIDIPLRDVVSILLDGCENLAMVGLVVGLLVRHLERAGDLLDSYLAEPFVWRIEVTRVVNESSGFAADSEGIVASERRNWSLHEAALFMGVRADEERTAELRELGDKLLTNARRHFVSSPDKLSDSVAASGDSIEKKLMPVRLWASCLDRDSYQALEASDGLYIHPTPPDDVLQALEPSNEELHRFQEATRLFVRYYVDPKKEGAQAFAPDELAADIAIARNLLECPPSLVARDPWDTAALIAAAALEAYLIDGTDLEDDALSFAAETVLRVGEGEASPRQFEFEETYFEQGADRTAARTLPLLLLPSAARLRAGIDKGDGWKAFERAARAGVNLARAISNEVRLHLARGLDHVWKTPCAMEVDGRCHHEVGWRIATETMRCCVFGGWDRATGRRTVLVLEDPLTESLAGTDDHKIRVARLDAAIRALCTGRRGRHLRLDASSRSAADSPGRSAAIAV